MNPNSDIKHQISDIARGKPNVAIVHDWLIGGGAEKVVLELHHMFPDAPIYTSYATKHWRRKLDDKVKTGFLQYWPFSKIRKYIPFLRILYFSNLSLNQYDLVISSSGAEAKGIRLPHQRPHLLPFKYQISNIRAKHVAYIHAPTHYYWSRYEEYLANPGFPKGTNWLARFALKVLVEPLRRWDYTAAQRPDFIIANSTHTQKQIKKYYKRDSTVVHPPVDTERFSKRVDIHQIPNTKYQIPHPRRGFVITGRQTPYKRVDLAVAACTELNVPLIVIGKGPEHAKLKKMAGKNVTFLTKVTDAEMPYHLQSAEAFIFPNLDDFGISPVEALAAGTPVIAYKAGGALDYINEKTGLLFTKQTTESLIEAIKVFQTKKYSHDGIKILAQSFSIANFHKNLRTELEHALQ